VLNNVIAQVEEKTTPNDDSSWRACEVCLWVKEL